MPRTRFALGLLPLAPMALLVFACARDDVAAIGLVMRAPQGVLDDASAIDLHVFDASRAKCSATGHVSAIPSGEGTQSFKLEHSGCPSGMSWCKTIELDEDGSDKMFAVQAKGPAGLLAEGCTTATIDQDPLEVSIKMQRYNPPSCCNDGALQTGEQCDTGQASQTTCDGSPGGQCLGIVPDSVCACDCKANEIALDRADADAATFPPAATKTAPSLAFAPGSGQLQNGLRAAFTDTDAGANGGSDIAVRALAKDLYPISDPQLTALFGPLRIPLRCTAPKGSGSLRMQQNASLAPFGSGLAVVYESDEKQATQLEVFLSEQSGDGCADAAPVQISTAVAGQSAHRPDVAEGPTGKALVVWSTDAGDVRGRIYTSAGGATAGTLDAEMLIASNTSGARVAGNAGGWVVVYAGSGAGDPDGVYMKTVDASGQLGAEKLVNAATAGVQDQPDVAMFGDGRFAVVWHGDGDVFIQRFDTSGEIVVGDQDAPLDTKRDGEQSNPAVAASVGFGDFYAVAWQSGGGVAARFAGAGGDFLYNSVTGQNDEFSATHPGIASPRSAPAVAIGGAGFVAIGWQDDSAEHAGVYVRRFPLPAAQ